MAARKAPGITGALTGAELARIVGVLKALGDPSRLRIVGLLADEGELTISELAERVGLSQPTITHHVSKLVAAGLARRRREGVWSMVSLNPDGFAGMAETLRPVRR